MRAPASGRSTTPPCATPRGPPACRPPPGWARRGWSTTSPS